MNGHSHDWGSDTTELLRFATAGSVDDGKSTLIGRLLHDAKSILADQLAHVKETSERRGDGELNLALLTDGLRAEREQGITIDVAYRSFQTDKRRFIIADCPGHEQYTRNMVTGASTADLSLVLVDARNGLVRQSRRHAAISALLRTPHLVVCVNKMDLVDYDQSVFDAIVADFTAWSEPIAAFSEITFIPISALKGDNVVDPSTTMPWYDGPTLLHHLETVEIAGDRNLDDWRFPVQWVVRPQNDERYHDYRGYAGQVAGGVLVPGEEVVVLPSGRTTKLAGIDTIDGPLDAAFPPQSVTLLLEDDLDVSRGDLIARPSDAPTVARELEAVVCWMTDAPLQPRGRYAIKHATRSVRGIVDAIDWRLNVETLEREEAEGGLSLNEIGHVKLRLSAPLAFDSYERNRDTGSFIVIDESTNDTVGAGLIVS
ncbi:GTP-binding protein [Conexibacter stalactiti]|uniref:sulfate adenylyltransferase n=1 Tax=Conexibacter stalactiti TaxID=1940611 RepID=A0ABU4HJX6_9ACTN|nr:GTP-binding protein [Conexibacter stalactiti]MDW5593605.1 GTP-binding protein [Conexibacter stalactiti]MEC5034246.1 GTP-binding protein [Conexibacter stalactiti]